MFACICALIGSITVYFHCHMNIVASYVSLDSSVYVFFLLYCVFVVLLFSPIFFFFKCYGDHRDLHVPTHSFPTRRSSDLLRRPPCSARPRPRSRRFRSAAW